MRKIITYFLLTLPVLASCQTDGFWEGTPKTNTPCRVWSIDVVTADIASGRVDYTDCYGHAKSYFPNFNGVRQYVCSTSQPVAVNNVSQHITAIEATGSTCGDPIDCGTNWFIGGGTDEPFFPAEVLIDAGMAATALSIIYDQGNKPVKIVVLTLEGDTLLSDPGRYRGLVLYQGALNDALASRGLPPEEIVPISPGAYTSGPYLKPDGNTSRYIRFQMYAPLGLNWQEGSLGEIWASPTCVN